MARGMNYSGMKFNYLTLLSYVRAGGQGVGAIWLARCDCGNTRDVTAKRVVHGQIRSCGKCELSRGHKSDLRAQTMKLRAAERKLYMRYITKASQKSIAWSLSPDQFIGIIRQSCRYCGQDPDRTIQGTTHRYNGIDRVDSDQGYTHLNSIPACSTCRALKGELRTAEFLDKVQAIAIHLCK